MIENLSMSRSVFFLCRSRARHSRLQREKLESSIEILIIQLDPEEDASIFFFFNHLTSFRYSYVRCFAYIGCTINFFCFLDLSLTN